MSRYQFKQKDNTENVVSYGYDKPFQGYFVDVITPSKDPMKEDTIVLEIGSNIILAGGNIKNVKSRGEIVETLENLGCTNKKHLQAIALDVQF